MISLHSKDNRLLNSQNYPYKDDHSPGREEVQSKDSDCKPGNTTPVSRSQCLYSE